MAASTDKGSVNDLDKHFKDGSQTKGIRPNLPPARKGRSGADYANEEYGKVVGVGPFMCRLFEKQLYTDVTFYFREKKTFFSAHRVVLAAKCEYFENLLFGKQMKDAVGMEMHVQINDVSLSVFTSIVKYFYTDAIQLTHDTAALEAYKAAKTYRIHSLVDQCRIYFDSVELTEENVCSKLEVCNARDNDALKRRCIGYIERNTYPVISSRDFEECSFATVRQICQLRVLSLHSEADLLEAVLRWINVRKMSKQEKKDTRRGLLKCVRFLSFTAKEFSGVVQKHPDLFTPEEGLQILVCLNDPCPDNVNRLPKWCNKDKNLRTCPARLNNPVLRSENADKRLIQISLKAAREQPRAKQLTSVLHMTGLRETHCIRSVTFSVGSVEAEGCALEILIFVSPNGPSFLKSHVIRSRESVLRFGKPVVVFPGQTLEMEVKAESSDLCEFLQFDNWFCAHLDFMCYFISKPTTGRLYFISGIEYEPISN